MPLPKRKYSERGDRNAGVAHPLYRVWYSMMRRCYVEGERSFSNYGGRGITVDPEWFYFKTFLTDMGERPSKSHTLERIDNEKGYSKTNCKWATRTEQCLNRRKFSNNTSGYTGIKKHKNDRWEAIYFYEKKRYSIGRFDTLEAAYTARQKFIILFNTDRDAAEKQVATDTVWETSSTGIRGITKHVDGYIVRVTKNGIRKYVGFYKSLEEAKDAKSRYIASRT